MLIPMLRRAAGVALATAAVAAAMSTPAWSQESNQQRGEIPLVVNQSQAALNTLVGTADMPWLKENIGRAKGILIAPEMRQEVKLGKPGGRALLVVKGADGKWHGPAFYNVETVAQGFKDGVKIASMVALVMTDKGVASLTAGSAMLGTDLMAVAGPVGAGATTDPAADVVAYTGTKKDGFSVLNVGGLSIKAFNDWNAAFYNSPSVQASSILQGKTTSRDAVSLLATVTKATGGPPPKKK
jgi:lipid-binding SYLF domain-containing protein